MALRTLSNPEPTGQLQWLGPLPCMKEHILEWSREKTSHAMLGEPEVVERPEKHVTHTQVRIRVGAQQEEKAGVDYRAG